MSSPFKTSVVKAAQAGDRSAVDRLGHESLPLVHQLVGHALHGHPEVDALARDTVRHALGGLGGLRRPADFRSYLVTTAVARIREHADYVYDLTLARPDFDFVDLMISRLGLSGQHREVAEATRWVDREHHALVALWWLETAGELTRPEVAAALAANSQQVDARIERMWHELDTARVVVRALSARPPCVLLEQLVGGWDGVPSPLWRERMAPHTYDCTVCSGYAAGLAPADTLVAGLALVPVGDRDAPAAASYNDGFGDGFGGGASSDGAASGAARGVPSDGSRTGARDALRRDRRAKRRRAVTVTAAVAALLTAGGVAQLVSGDRDKDESRASTAVEPETLEPKSAASRTAESASFSLAQQREPVALADPFAVQEAGEAEQVHARPAPLHRRSDPEARSDTAGGRPQAGQWRRPRRPGHHTRQLRALQGRLRPGEHQHTVGHRRAAPLPGHGGQGLLRPQQPGRQGPRRPHHGGGLPVDHLRREHRPGSADGRPGDGGLDEKPRPPGQHTELRLQGDRRRRPRRDRRTVVDPGVRRARLTPGRVARADRTHALRPAQPPDRDASITISMFSVRIEVDRAGTTGTDHSPRLAVGPYRSDVGARPSGRPE